MNSSSPQLISTYKYTSHGFLLSGKKGFWCLQDTWTMNTIRTQSDSIYSIFVVGPCYIHSIQNADDIIQRHISKWMIKCASVFVLYLGKMTWIMLSVLTTLETNNINRVNRVKQHTDGDEFKMLKQFLGTPFPFRSKKGRKIYVQRSRPRVLHNAHR